MEGDRASDGILSECCSARKLGNFRGSLVKDCLGCSDTIELFDSGASSVCTDGCAFV